MAWTPDGAYLAVITARGDVALVARFGEPVRMAQRAEGPFAWVLPWA